MNALLSMSFTGTATLFLWAVLNRVAGKRLPAAWHTAILRFALFLTLVPVTRFPALLFGFHDTITPAVPPQTVSVIAAKITPITESSVFARPLLSLPAAVLQTLAAVWMTGSVIMLALRLRDYIRFRRLLRRSVPEQNPETLRIFTECRQDTKTRLVINPDFPTPLTTGLFHPVIVLPDIKFSGTEQKCLFLHELTHIRRHDLWTRFFAMLSQCLYWWNPAVAVLRQELHDWEERRCDEEVSRLLDGAERKSYGLTLLWLASASAIGGGWAASFSSGHALKERLERVIRPRALTGQRARLAAVVLVTAFAGAVAAVQTPLVARSDNPNPTRSLTAQERLILRRGGTLLPDGNPDAWSDAHKLYIDRNGVLRLVDRIGNADALPAVARRLLYELQDGDYPRNGRGDTYGRQMMEDYVGYAPDLRYAGTDLNGYIDPVELDAVPSNLPAEQCPHRFCVPLYDSERRKIGEYAVSCGGHDALSDMTIEEAKLIVGLAGIQNWQSADELKEYLSQHWDKENRRLIP